VQEAPPVAAEEESQDVDSEEESDVADKPKFPRRKKFGESWMRAEACSREHLLAHYPKNPYCPACKITNVPEPQRRAGTFVKGKDKQIQEFGALVGVDHKIHTISTVPGVEGSTASLAVCDVGTRFVAYEATKGKSVESAVDALRRFGGSSDVKILRSDGAGELKVAAHQMGWSHQPSPAHDCASKAVIERHLGILYRQARVLLVRSGLPESYWPYAGSTAAHSSNVMRKNSKDQSPYFLRHGQEYDGPMVPFGAAVKVKLPAEARARSSYEPDVDPAIYLGPMMAAGQVSGHIVALETDLAANKKKVYIVSGKRLIQEENCRFPFYKELPAADGQLSEAAKKELPKRKVGVDFWPVKTGSHRPDFVSPQLWLHATKEEKSESIRSARRAGQYKEPSTPGPADWAESQASFKEKQPAAAVPSAASMSPQEA